MDIGGILDGISANVPHSEREYIGDDGLLHCEKCHKAVQTRVTFMGVEKIVRCICDCQKAKMDEREERLKQEERQRQRMICFADTEYCYQSSTVGQRVKGAGHLGYDPVDQCQVSAAV